MGFGGMVYALCANIDLSQHYMSNLHNLSKLNDSTGNQLNISLPFTGRDEYYHYENSVVVL